MLNGLLKLNHWSIFFLFIFLGTTGIFGCTIFSHDTIIPNLEYAYGINEIQSGKASQVFISKVMRGLMWDWHYIAGIAFTILVLIGSTVAIFNRYSFKKNPMPFVLLIVTIILAATGVLRYYRGEIPFMGESDKFIRNLPKHIHHYSSWALLVAVTGHTLHMMHLNATKYKTIISNMFTSKNLHLRGIMFFLVCILAFSNASINLYAEDESFSIIKYLGKAKEDDKNYKEAMEYYSGKKGFWHEERKFPNCPYDACEKSNDVVESFEKDGSRYYNIKMHNFVKAKEFFDKSVTDTKNPLSAEKNIIMIMERINYKGKYYEEYLLEHVKESLGIDGEDAIKKEVKKNLAYIDVGNSSMMLYKAAEVYEHGYFGVERDIDKAKLFYQTVLEKNDTKNMYFMLSKNKLSILAKKDN